MTADSGGAFIFDIYFPPTYPSVPPQVLLKTTGERDARPPTSQHP